MSETNRLLTAHARGSRTREARGIRRAMSHFLCSRGSALPQAGLRIVLYDIDRQSRTVEAQLGGHIMLQPSSTSSSPSPKDSEAAPDSTGCENCDFRKESCEYVHLLIVSHHAHRNLQWLGKRVLRYAFISHSQDLWPRHKPI